MEFILICNFLLGATAAFLLVPAFTKKHALYVTLLSLLFLLSIVPTFLLANPHIGVLPWAIRDSLLLFSALLLFYLTFTPSRWKMILFFLLFLLSIAPLAYVVYDDFTHTYIDANIGLGLGFLLTWFLTTLYNISAILRFFRQKSQ
ncbi:MULTISPECIES: hypothetical protein [Priestia]|jgi:hypothetical protein|uniref:hypothetical protein n=1 Tax=Priestia TaxID=2800373 RepID=UPI00203F14B8|nr:MULTISPECIES: hypothetical protein [Priestia]MCM3770635.1 hypothetical protein [Priestia aryabhattai]MDY0941005.1 hypothetical protein [Priestia megaterium]